MILTPPNENQIYQLAENTEPIKQQTMKVDMFLKKVDKITTENKLSKEKKIMALLIGGC